MSDNQIKVSTGPGIGFGGLLFLVFLVLKLTHVIDWSWWWVTCPLWIGTVICLGFISLCGLGWVIAATILFFTARCKGGRYDGKP